MKTFKPVCHSIFSLPGIKFPAKRLPSFFAILIFIILGSSQLFAQDVPEDYLDTTKWAGIDIPKAKLAGKPTRGKPAAAQTLAGTVNPDIPQSLLCKDLRVVFILDESGSINGTESETVRTGAKALANALLNSGATLQLVEFSSLSSIVNLGGTSVNSSFITNLNAYLGFNNGSSYTGSGYSGQTYNPGSGSGNCSGWTNWEDALIDVSTIDADLIIFFTDGNPTAYNVTSGGTNCSGQRIITNASDVNALPPAITQADIIKGQGKHMFLVGVGDDLNLSNIQAISGTDEFGPSHNILTADYTTPPFTELASDLTKAVNAICGTVLTIDKTPSSDGVCAGQTVTFTHTLTNTGGDYNFTAFSVAVKDVYPNGYSNIQLIAPIPAGATISGGNTVNIPVGDMTAGQTLTYQVQATINAPPGDFTSIVTATAFNADEVSDNAAVASGQAKGEITIKTCKAQEEVNGELLDAPGTYVRNVGQSILPPNCDSILTIIITRSTANAPILTIEDKCSGSTITAKDGDGNLITEGLTWSNGATGNPIDVTNTDEVTATVTIGECTSEASNSVTPSPKAIPAAPILSVENNCDGTSVITAKDVTEALIEAGLLTWSNGATGNPITVTDATTVTATVNTNGCPSNSSIEVNPAPKQTPAPPVLTVDNTCNGNSIITAKDVSDNLITTGLTWSNGATGNPITVTSSATVTATVTTGGTCTSSASNSITPAPRSKSSSIETLVACNSYLWHGATYTASNTTATWVGTNAAGCDSTVTLNLTINKSPTIGALNCPGNICRKQTGVVFTVAAGTGATSYEWVLPTGVTGTSTTNSITVAISSTFTTGAVKVRAKNACGYSDYVTCTITSPTTVPAVPSCIYGPTSVCAPGTYTYYVNPVSGATSYAWTVSGTGLTIASGQGNASITVTVTSSCKSGTISVKAVNCIGSCSAKSICVTTISAPAKPGTITGSSTGVCKKTNVAYSVTAVPGATSYVWTVPSGSTITSGANTNSIKLTFGSTFTGTGTITVAAKNSCGTSAASSKNITITKSRPLPDGTAVEEVTAVNDNVYPNPSNGLFKISFNTAKTEKVAINVTDVMGRVIYKSVNTYQQGNHLNNINVSKFAKGTYFVNIVRSDKQKSIRIFIQ